MLINPLVVRTPESTKALFVSRMPENIPSPFILYTAKQCPQMAIEVSLADVNISKCR